MPNRYIRPLIGKTQSLVSAARSLARRPTLFALVGCVNTAIDFGVFAILTEFSGIPPLIANVISYLMGATNSLIMNGMITFRGNGVDLFSLSLILRFVLVTGVCLGISSIALAVALVFVPSLFAKIFAIAVAFISGFLMYSRLVYTRANA
jgi:putative flippase GtrA